MKVRAMSKPDCRAVARIYEASFARQQDHFDWINSNFNAHPRTLYYVAEEEQGVQGYIQWTQKSGFRAEVVLELEQLAVHPDARGKGVAKHLIRKSLPMVKAKLKERNATLKHVLVSTRTDNFAQKLYKDTLGAEPEYIIKNLYSADEVFMIARNINNDFLDVFLDRNANSNYVHSPNKRLRTGMENPSTGRV